MLSPKGRKDYIALNKLTIVMDLRYDCSITVRTLCAI